LTFRFNDEGRNGALARAVAASWQRVLGLKVKLVPMTWKDYRAMATSSAGFDGAFLESWSPDYPGPEQYVGPLFSAAGVGKSNWSHFTSPSFDNELARTIRGQEEPADLAVSYSGAERFLCANLPLLPIVFGRSATGVDVARIGSASPTATGAHDNPYLHHSTAAVLLRELYRKDLP
jgi:ABC-type oligopeptide transport system substrate-binding subunit